MPTVETNGVETYYEHRGRGPPIVFVHGASNDSRWWEPQMASFADDFEVVAYDVRGHGRTGGSDRSHYSMELFAADLRALVAELGLDRPVVVGHSLGGMFALEYAARYPDTLRGLVLADSQVAPGLTPMQSVLQHGLIPLRMGIQRVLGPDRASALTEWIARRLAEVDGPEDDELAAYADETDEMFAPEESLKVLGAVRRFERPDLASIDVPTLGVYGKEDPAMMHRNAVELGREVPRAELRLVPETGHGLTWERPAAFERTVREFLEKENVTPERA